MTDEQKDQFYFQGKYFDNEKEFFEYARAWLEFPLDQQTAERELDTLKKEIVMNIFLRGVKLNNGQFRELLNKIFEFTITLLDLKTYHRTDGKYDELE